MSHKCRAGILGLFALGLLASCRHARSTGPEEGRTAPTETSPEPVHVTRNKVPLAETPAQLRKEGGTEAIVEALKARGYLSGKENVSASALSAAVKKFQDSQGLAASGFADDETLRKLGLDPQVINRTSSSPGK